MRRSNTRETNGPVVLVTGASGFIGNALCRRLTATGKTVRAIVRRGEAPARAEPLTVNSLADIEHDNLILRDVDTVIYLAGRAHAPHLNVDEQEKAFAADAEMTARFVETAARARVRRFIFVSTAKVYGEMTVGSECFSNTSKPGPNDAYTRYKLLAEDAVRDVAERHGMEWVVVRPVLVYGSNVKGNLATLARWLDSGRVLPFDGLRNQRSLLALSDLVGLLDICISNPAVVGQRLVAASDDSISTTGICRALAEGLGKQPRLISLPGWGWALLRAVPFTRGRVDRLTGSFLVDNSMTKSISGWQPRAGTYEGLVQVGKSCKTGKEKP